ncbi:hypothetical protein MRBLBA21_001944 [Peribacillus frigoritolerans]|uniref:hypothetical protein n=1 Tax=Peribacillus frigoritolerans TaxID=450367 RepID=UPI00343589B4
MNKARLQGLSAGIIFTTTIFAAFYYGTGKFEGTTPTAEEAKKTVQPKDPDKVLMEKEASTYTIKVKTNMTTAEIADRLSKEKIIDDAAEFEAYMNDRDFSKKYKSASLLLLII